MLHQANTISHHFSAGDASLLSFATAPTQCRSTPQMLNTLPCSNLLLFVPMLNFYKGNKVFAQVISLATLNPHSSRYFSCS